jgi:hypothetical protein
MLSDVNAKIPGYSLVISISKHKLPFPIVSAVSKTGLCRINWIDGNVIGWRDGIIYDVLGI